MVIALVCRYGGTWCPSACSSCLRLAETGWRGSPGCSGGPSLVPGRLCEGVGCGALRDCLDRSLDCGWQGLSKSLCILFLWLGVCLPHTLQSQMRWMAYRRRPVLHYRRRSCCGLQCCAGLVGGSWLGRLRAAEWCAVVCVWRSVCRGCGTVCATLLCPAGVDPAHVPNVGRGIWLR